MSTKINNGLFMGDVDAAQDAEFLSLNGIEFIVNCVPREVPNVFEPDGIRYMACDMAEQPESILFDMRNQDFNELMAFIDHAMQASLSLLVHSLDGLSRSPCVMMAYLMMKYYWSLDKAYEYVKMKRPDINPHPAYLDQLAMLDTQLLKKFHTPEKKRNEWDPAFVDLKTDELVLVNTFLNITHGLALPSKPTPRKLPKKKRLLWIDMCPHMRKLHPYYDFTKLERPPSASYSSLSAGNGWVDTEQPHYPVTRTLKEDPPSAKGVVDLTLSDDEDNEVNDDEDDGQERLKEDDSWDMSMSDPGQSHDADFDKFMALSTAARPPPPLTHRSSFPSQHIKKTTPESFAPQVMEKPNPPPSDRSQLSQNQQHSPTGPDTNAVEAKHSHPAHPRYLQHTKSSRNAKTIKAAQGRYAMPTFEDKSRPSVVQRRPSVKPIDAIDIRAVQDTRLPMTTKRATIVATTRPKTAPPAVTTRIATSVTFKKKPVPKQPQRPPVPKAPIAFASNNGEAKKALPDAKPPPPRRIPSAKWR
ncbi:hypothetical protein AC1031_000282 [Aphanomyces cochlioides]|nr:hypothetical protein AC1031_000282 [Aphanomyces cochlioides]